MAKIEIGANVHTEFGWMRVVYEQEGIVQLWHPKIKTKYVKLVDLNPVTDQENVYIHEAVANAE